MDEQRVGVGGGGGRLGALILPYPILDKLLGQRPIKNIQFKSKSKKALRFNGISICLGSNYGALFTGVIKSLTVQGILV